MQESEAIYRRALESKEKAWKLEHLLTRGTVKNLGFFYSNNSKMQKAQVMY